MTCPTREHTTFEKIKLRKLPVRINVLKQKFGQNKNRVPRLTKNGRGHYVDIPVGGGREWTE